MEPHSADIQIEAIRLWDMLEGRSDREEAAIWLATQLADEAEPAKRLLFQAVALHLPEYRDLCVRYWREYVTSDGL